MKEVQLKDICDLDNGFAFKSDDYVDESNTLNCRMSNIRPDGSFDILYSAKYLPDEFVHKYKDYILRDGDLIIAMTDMAGDPKILGVPTVVNTRGYNLLLNQRVGKLRLIKNGVNIDYLKLALQCPNVRHYLKRFAGGGVQLNVSKKDILNAPVRMRSEDEQKYIAALFKQVLEVKTRREQELQLLDKLIQARFIEMFGDPLDKSLANKYFVECVEFNPKKSEVKDLMNEKVSFVPMECVGADGSFTIKEDGVIKDYYKGYTYFRDGDVLLAKITPCFENGKVAIAKNCTNGIGFGTTEFHVSRPIAGVSNSYWIKYMLKNENVHGLATINMTGSAGQKRIQTPFFEKLKIYLPPIELQNQFADFVRATDKLKVT